MSSILVLVLVLILILILVLVLVLVLMVMLRCVRGGVEGFSSVAGNESFTLTVTGDFIQLEFLNPTQQALADIKDLVIIALSKKTLGFLFIYYTSF